MITTEFVRELGTPKIVKYSNGDIYTGNIDSHKKNGKGCMYYQNDDIYLGTWENDLPSGFGILILHNHSRF